MAQRTRRDAARTRTAKAKFSEIVVVCSKCAKRQGMSERAVRSLLKEALRRGRPGTRLKILEAGCLGPCPKRALAVATGASTRRGRILLLDPGATAEEALDAILPEIPDLSPKPPLTGRPADSDDGIGG